MLDCCAEDGRICWDYEARIIRHYAQADDYQIRLWNFKSFTGYYKVNIAREYLQARGTLLPLIRELDEKLKIKSLKFKEIINEDFPSREMETLRTVLQSAYQKR